MIHKQLREDSVAALKARDSQKRQALIYLISELNKIAKDEYTETLSDERAIRVLQKQLKQRHETLDAARKAARINMIEETLYEIELTKSYLPAGLSEEEMLSLAKKVIAELNATSRKQMGQVMTQLGEEAPAADKTKLSAIVKELLA